MPDTKSLPECDFNIGGSLYGDAVGLSGGIENVSPKIGERMVVMFGLNIMR